MRVLAVVAVPAVALLAFGGCEKARRTGPNVRPAVPAAPAAPAAPAPVEETKPPGPSVGVEETGPSARGALDLGTGAGGLRVDPFAGSRTDVKTDLPRVDETGDVIVK